MPMAAASMSGVVAAIVFHYISVYPSGAYCKPTKPGAKVLGGGVPVKRENKPALLNRLNRIEGQVRGIARMVEEDRYCIDVLTQLQAARAALVRVETEMLRDHLSHCVEDAIVSGDADEQRKKAAELIELLERAAR